MDRHTRLRLASCGLAFLSMTAGCKSLLHRHEIPPEPAAATAGTRETAPAQFGSDPQTQRMVEGPARPNGPTSSALGSYGPQAPNASPSPNSGAPAQSAVGSNVVDPFALPAGDVPAATPSVPPAGNTVPMGLEGGPG